MPSVASKSGILSATIHNGADRQSESDRLGGIELEHDHREAGQHEAEHSRAAHRQVEAIDREGERHSDPEQRHDGHGLQNAEQVIDAQERGLFGLEQYDERAEYEEDCVPASPTDESLSSEA
jgi:hypothetical protein